MDLDDELRKLFNDDDRLDLHVSPQAEETVVRGAQRRRRRRGAAAGAFAVVALIGAGAGVLQLRHVQTTDVAREMLPTISSTPSAPPLAPYVTTHTETVIVTADPGVPDSGTTVGAPVKPPTGNSSTPRSPEPEPGGWGKLKLAMSESDARKTGVLAEPAADTVQDEKCKKYPMQSVAEADAVIISTAKGVVRITLPSYAKTTKNIGVGSKVADVKTAYPTAAQNGSELVVQMNASPKWVYVFENDGTAVTKVRQRLSDNDCAGV